MPKALKKLWVIATKITLSGLLIKVLFHLSLIRMSQGVAIMEKLREELPKIDEDLIGKVKLDLAREVEKIKKTDWVTFEMENI